MLMLPFFFVLFCFSYFQSFYNTEQKKIKERKRYFGELLDWWHWASFEEAEISVNNRLRKGYREMLPKVFGFFGGVNDCFILTLEASFFSRRFNVMLDSKFPIKIFYFVLKFTYLFIYLFACSANMTRVMWKMVLCEP